MAKKEPLRILADTDIDLIIAADQNGNRLEFSVENFKELPEKEWKKLSPEGIASYISTREAVKRGNESLSDPPLPAFSITPEGASATAQLSVEGRDPKMHYAYVRPYEVGIRERQGYVKANQESDKDLIVFNRRGSTPFVGTVANPELVLMKIPEKKFQEEILGPSVRESQRNNGNLESTTAERIEQQGVIVNRTGGKKNGK